MHFSHKKEMKKIVHLNASYRELKDISLKQKKKTDKQAKNRMKMKTKTRQINNDMHLSIFRMTSV